MRSAERRELCLLFNCILLFKTNVFWISTISTNGEEFETNFFLLGWSVIFDVFFIEHGIESGEEDDLSETWDEVEEELAF